MHTKQARAILVYMRRHLVLAVAACWATASAAIVDGAARVLAAADAAAAAPVAGRTLWMYWQQGEDHLKARPAGSWYSYGHRCSHAPSRHGAAQRRPTPPSTPRCGWSDGRSRRSPTSTNILSYFLLARGLSVGSRERVREHLICLSLVVAGTIGSVMPVTTRLL